MKIRCLSKKREYVKNDNSLLTDKNSEYEFLEIGKEYIVYGMILKQGQIEYYICDCVHELFPISRPAVLFEIIDNHLSHCWIFDFVEGVEKYPSWNFREWITEP